MYCVFRPKMEMPLENWVNAADQETNPRNGQHVLEIGLQYTLTNPD
jgi:hypothetical protein